MSNGFDFPQDKQEKMAQHIHQANNPEPPRLKSVRPPSKPTATIVPQINTIIQPPAHAVPVVVPSAKPLSDVEALAIDLPHRFHYYDFKDLYARPFRGRHMSKLAKAHELGSLQIMAETISTVLVTHDNRTDIAFDLSLEDFNSILYWLRLRSFGKPQIRFTHYCQDPTHREKVANKEMDESTLKITTVYREADIKTLYMELAPDPEHYFVEYKGVRIGLRPGTVRDAVQTLDDDRWQDIEFQTNAEHAACLNPDDVENLFTEADYAALSQQYNNIIPEQVLLATKEHYRSMAYRISIAEDLSLDDILLIGEFRKSIDQYGVEEIVSTKCMGCGASRSVKMTVDAPTFLSPEF